MSWVIPRVWSAESCVIIAGGPSSQEVSPDDIPPDHHVIAVNGAYKRFPNADLLYFVDRQWWRKREGHIREIFRGVIVTPDEVEGVNCIERIDGVGYSYRQDVIYSGGSRGYEALHLATLLGCTRILLVGYEGHVQRNGERIVEDWVHHFDVIAMALQVLGVEVVNCSPGSAIGCWPIQPLCEALQLERTHHG